VDFLSRRHLRLDGIEESDELLMAMMLHVAADDGAVEDVGLKATRPTYWLWIGGSECDTELEYA
jgi:hypothetical protein